MTHDFNKSGGPAFPHAIVQFYGGEEDRTPFDGMTLRDWFAGQALTGIIANPDISKAATKNKLNVEDFRRQAAEAAYAEADVMLKAREPK